MNSIDTLIKTICIILDLEPLNGSYVDALGLYFNVVDQPDKAYNREVLVAALVNGTIPGTSEVLIFDTFADFPATGDANSLYVAKDANVIYRWDDVLTSYQVLNDPNVVNPDAPEEGQTFYARLATTTTLNANTYNNGTAGVGATLTGNANGVLSQTNQTGRIDNTVPVVGDIILVKNEASTIKNGIYEVTQVGTAGTPYILTRIDGYNETAEVYPSIVFVSAGSNNLNRYFTQNTANPVIGTNGLVYGVAAVSSPALPTMFMDTYLDDMTTLPGTYTYTNGTTFLTLPGYGANLRANANGALGTISGVAMTSGRRLLINDPNFPLRNGDYTVSNAGSATQRWQLTRINYANSGFNYLVREWFVSNQNSTRYGCRFSVNSGVLVDAQIGISQNINFKQQNLLGLKTTNNTIQLNDTDGVTDVTFETSNTVGFGVYNGLDESEFQLEVGSIFSRVTDGTKENNLIIEMGGVPKIALASTDGTDDSALEVRGNGTIGIDASNDIDIASANADVSVYANGSVDITADNGQINVIGNIVGTNGLILDGTTNDIQLNTEAGNQYVELSTSLQRIRLEAGDGADIESSIALTTQGAGEVKLYSTDGSNEASIGVTNAGVINVVADAGLAMSTNGQMTLTTSVDSIVVTSATIIDLTSGNGSIFLGANNGDIVLTAADATYFVKLQGLDTYASDALAGAGGVPQNAIYKDATGLLRIKL